MTANVQNGGHKASGKKNLENNSKKKFRTGYNPRKRCLAIPHPTAKEGSGFLTTRETERQKEKKI